jgi:hypothetical protein
MTGEHISLAGWLGARGGYSSSFAKVWPRSPSGAADPASADGAVGVQLGINVALQGKLLQRFSVAALQSGLNSDGNVRFL